MKIPAILFLGASLFIAGSFTGFAANESWPQWRGPLATGEAPTSTPPIEWSETKNLKWKIKIPGFGTSTPIISGNRIFRACPQNADF